MKATAEVKPISEGEVRRTDGHSYDTSVWVRLFDLTEVSVRRVMQEFYHIYPHNSERNPQNEKRMRYRANGTWGKYRDLDGHLCIGVSVGCNHDYDCCGCLCSLRHIFSITQGMLVVTTVCGYNY